MTNEEIKKQIIDMLWSHAIKVYGAGSCGELGYSFMAIDADSFSEIADDILQNFEPKKCMPDNINSKEEYEQYLKAILNVTDKPVGELLHMFWQRLSDACPFECTEAEKQESEFKEWVKSISWVLD